MSNDKSLLTGILQYFKETYEVSAHGNNIKLGARSFTPIQFAKKFKEEKEAIIQKSGRLAFYEFIDKIEKSKGLPEDKILEQMSDRVFQVLNKEFNTKKVTALNSTNGGFSNQFSYSGHIPVMDVKTRRKCLYNTVTQRVSHELSFESFEDWKRLRTQEERQIINDMYASIVIEYNPYSSEEVYYKDIENQKDILHVNNHKIPEWRRLEIKEPKLPKEYIELMNHVFPEEACRNYVHHWVYFMLTARNETILLLHGEQGIGKGTLVEIWYRLVGMENYALIGSDFWEGRFNSAIADKRLVYFDETVITTENVTKLRSLTNLNIEIEAKGLDSYNTTNHASFIISNNLDKQNYVVTEDRRYSVPILTKIKADKALGQEKLDTLFKKIESDPDFIANIGWWILKNGNKGDYNPHTAYKTKAFYELTEKALFQWQRAIIDLIRSGMADKYSLDDYKDELRGTGRVKVERFLDSHTDENGELYGYLGQEKGDRYIYPDKRFHKNQNEEDFFNEDY